MNLADIKKLVRKPKEKEVLITWFTTRKISPYITFFLLKTPITPNQITIFMTLLNFIGLVILFFNPFIGIIIIQIAYTLDCVDGEVARAKDMQSKIGHYLDEVGHFLTIPPFYMVISLRVFANTSNHIFIILGIIMMISTYLRLSEIPNQIIPIEKKTSETKGIRILGGTLKITDLLHNYVYLLFITTIIYLLYLPFPQVTLLLEKIFIISYSIIFLIEIPLIIQRDIKSIKASL